MYYNYINTEVDFMKTKLLLSLAVLSLMAIPANAELTVDDVTSREYMRNYGYSNAVIDALELKKGAVNGEKVYLPYDIEQEQKTPFKQWFHKWASYFDPALDDAKFLREDTVFYPSTNDL